MKEYDAVIIGGGPVGGYVAGKLAEKKLNVAVFEKNKQTGMPVNCAGLITPKVFDSLNISKELVVQNKIKGANIHSPSGNVLTIGGDKLHAFVIDRSRFDREIIQKSKQNGAEVYLDNNVLSIQKIDDHIELKTSQNFDVKCKLLIGADGPRSKTRDRFSFPEPMEFLRGLGAEITGTNLNPDFVEIFVGRDIAPGFFAWIIPLNKDGTRARIGLCINQDSPNPPKYYFSNFFKHKNSSPFLENIEINKHIGGVIPLGVLKKTYDSNVLLVGDAAAQVKPSSGGGIYTGLLCAGHCSDVALDAFQANDFSSSFLKKYHKLWTADIGRELNLGMKFRRIFRNLTDNQFDKYIERFQDPKITKIISEYGDIDYPSKLVKPLLKKAPSLLKILPSVIKEKYL
jgi:geranylgeranyl reductase family protein